MKVTITGAQSSIHQYTLIRPCNDIHTFYTTRLRTLNFKKKKAL